MDASGYAWILIIIFVLIFTIVQIKNCYQQTVFRRGHNTSRLNENINSRRYSQSVYNLDDMDQFNHSRRIDQTQTVRSYSSPDHIASRREDNAYYTSSAILPPPQYVITTKADGLPTYEEVLASSRNDLNINTISATVDLTETHSTRTTVH